MVPAIRAGLQLERSFGNLANVFKAVEEGSLRAYREIYQAGTGKDAPIELPADITERTKLQLYSFLQALMGADIPVKAKSGGKSVAHEEWFGSLYRIGTGWLGWSPIETLTSTPAQIMAAYDGRVELLQSIFGSGDGQSLPSPEELPFKIDAILSTMPNRRFIRRDGKLQEVH